MLAARMGNDDVVKLLLDSGAKINARENGGKTALNLAVGAHKDETAKLLRAKGAH
jgi:ankyrin repeat protein